ncbi:DUF695 domain-containing protein [Niabella beijingensis]|uniref:DUF695 domain-containing protein n=1 Tax=Niabella beijingensis TaxID=2872700 RepID=UPI001CBACB3E|nr:DUF695 domain-containing protein [Niabella beijingensis]MBZ4189170.1 DUF695 domain-containing protein [Niabella beijingensis]
MRFLKNIFRKKDEPVKNYADFWSWFQKHEKTFFNVVKNQKDVETEFFDKLSPKLSALKEGYFYLTGMYDDNTVELILTADGNTKNIAFVEELVEQAPDINGWKFTALKPVSDIKSTAINMGGYQFDSDNLFFYSNDYAEYPDEIDISIVHDDLTEENRQQIKTGVYIFLDNYLGELDFVNNIDDLKIIGKHEAEKELIPILKLKEFLNWRQKEFIEKYEGARYDTESDEHSIFEAELENGNNLIAVINTQLLNWDSKASHPWIAAITFKYDGSNSNGMPDGKDYESLNRIEENILEELSDKEGYLYIGRQTANSEREIYFACKDFRKPSKVFFKIQQENDYKFEIDYDIYKDKYWQSFERFRSN